MRLFSIITLAAALLSALPFRAAATAPDSLNPQVSAIVSNISEDRIAATQKKLESFGTRNIYSSQDDPQHGIGAARRWIREQFQSYSPKLQVSFDEHGIKAYGRVYKDVKIYNVVAVLPGVSEPERRLIVSGHYDSMNMVFKTGPDGKRVLDAEPRSLQLRPE
jgi:hypothetical protein